MDTFFEYHSASSYEGIAIIFKSVNAYLSSGIFISGSTYADDGRVFKIYGIPSIIPGNTNTKKFYNH